MLWANKISRDLMWKGALGGHIVLCVFSYSFAPLLNNLISGQIHVYLSKGSFVVKYIFGYQHGSPSFVACGFMWKQWQLVDDERNPKLLEAIYVATQHLQLTDNSHNDNHKKHLKSNATTASPFLSIMWYYMKKNMAAGLQRKTQNTYSSGNNSGISLNESSILMIEHSLVAQLTHQ